MFQDFSSRMHKAVQQENRNIQASLSGGKKKKTHHGGCGMALLILSPIAIVVLVLAAVQTASMWSIREQEIYALTQSAEHEVAQHQITDAGNDNKKRIGSPNRQQQQPAVATASHSRVMDTLVLTTKHGKIRITLRPDLSSGSVDYIHQLVQSGVCRRCNLYRAEKPGILQGIMANKDIPVNAVRGDCPPGLENVANDCPTWDAHCGCHGPVMTKGAVAWAAGQAGGPDFFIDNYAQPAKWWGTQHTNFGFITDEDSFKVVDAIFNLPINKQGMMTMLQDQIHFDLSLEKPSET
jgi:cyclophilin family peptidyl-prolyl cis-trans isomerase